MCSEVNYHDILKNREDRAASVNAALIRLVPNLSGHQASKRKLYGHVVRSIMIYAAPVWEDALKKQVKRK